MERIINSTSECCLRSSLAIMLQLQFRPRQHLLIFPAWIESAQARAQGAPCNNPSVSSLFSPIQILSNPEEWPCADGSYCCRVILQWRLLDSYNSRVGPMYRRDIPQLPLHQGDLTQQLGDPARRLQGGRSRSSLLQRWGERIVLSACRQGRALPVKRHLHAERSHPEAST